MKVLIVDDDQASLEFMADSVEGLGHSAFTASNGVEGLQAYREFNPRLVISDIRMPEMDGLELLKNIRSENPDASVVIATAFGCEEYAAQALQLGAEGYLSKPIRQSDLFPLLLKYEELHQEDNRVSTVRRMVSERRFRMEIDNRMGLLSDIAGQLVREAGGMFEKGTEASLYLGLYELLANAVEHGNLEISYEERHRAVRESPNGLGDLIGARLMNSELANRRVTIECVIDREGCQWTVTDEGKGFDWRRYLKDVEGTYPTHCEQRGILLNLMRFDELEYLGRGNAVRAKKFFERHQPSPESQRN